MKWTPQNTIARQSRAARRHLAELIAVAPQANVALALRLYDVLLNNSLQQYTVYYSPLVEAIYLMMQYSLSRSSDESNFGTNVKFIYAQIGLDRICTGCGFFRHAAIVGYFSDKTNHAFLLPFGMLLSMLGLIGFGLYTKLLCHLRIGFLHWAWFCCVPP